MPECCDYFSTNNHVTAFPRPHRSMRLAFVRCIIVLVSDFLHLDLFGTPSPFQNMFYSNIPRHESFLVTWHTAQILMAGLTHNILILNPYPARL